MEIQIGGDPPIENGYLLEFGRERSRVAHEQLERWEATQPKKPTLSEVLAQSDIDKRVLEIANRKKVEENNNNATMITAVIIGLITVIWIICSM